MIFRESGIFLSEEKKELLVARLSRRLRSLGLRSFNAYYRIAKASQEERVQMLDCICTNETHFFREPRQFEFLHKKLLPRWKAEAECGHMPRRIRAWSAGCSTGEEPYSLAMALLDHLPGWTIEILASDLSTRALERAREAMWPVDRANEIPPKYLKHFMLKGRGRQIGKMKAGPELLSVVQFQRVNLNDETYPVSGRFDLILCRNVLIYFRADSRTQVIQRLLRYLVPTGHLFVGHAESLSTMPEFRPVIPTVYGLTVEGAAAVS
jgi:chemotaxis protein methyltransferase CheR